MKLSRLLLLVNIIVLGIAGIIALPSINAKIYGMNIKFDAEVIKDLFQGRFANLRLDNTRDFMQQQLYVMEMTGLNAPVEEGETAMSEAQKNEIFERNFSIIRQRIDFMGMGDYNMRKVITEDKKYFIEVELPEDQINSTILGTLISEGEYKFYEFDENYKAPENKEENTFDFLQGKKPSELLSLQDAVQIKHYFNADIVPNGGYAISIDFGAINADKVALAAAGQENFDDVYRRLWIVQGQFPVAIQLAPVLPSVSNQTPHSEVVFTTFASQDDPDSRMLSMAIASSLKTQPINTSIVVSATQALDPSYGTGTIEVLKVFFILVFALIVLISIAVFRKKGMILGLTIFAHSILAIALAKFISLSLTIGLVWGMVGGFVFFALSLGYYLFSKNRSSFADFDDYRKQVWLVSTLLLGTSVIAALLVNSLMLYSILGFVVSLIAALITYEMTVKFLVSVFNIKK